MSTQPSGIYDLIGRNMKIIVFLLRCPFVGEMETLLLWILLSGIAVSSAQFQVRGMHSIIQWFCVFVPHERSVKLR